MSALALLWEIERADEGAFGLSAAELDMLEALLRRVIESQDA